MRISRVLAKYMIRDFDGIQHKRVATSLRSVNEKERTIDFVSSTEAPDRYGDVVRVSGWDLTNFNRNPVFLFGHRSSEPPIGRVVKSWTENNPPALVQRVQFATKDVYPFADTIFKLYQEKFMNAVSVGFQPLEQPRLLPDSDGYEFTSQELLELSAVPIPANPEALARGLVSERDIERLFDHEEDSENLYIETLEDLAAILPTP